MPIPTDRGYVAITDLDDGGKRVEIFARKGRTGPSHLFAAYRHARDVVVETDTLFEPWGAGSVSDEIVEVSFDEGRIFVRDPADMSEHFESLR